MELRELLKTWTTEELQQLWEDYYIQQKTDPITELVPEIIAGALLELSEREKV